MPAKRYSVELQECYPCTPDGMTHYELVEDNDGDLMKYSEILIHRPSDRIMLKRCMMVIGHPEGCGDHSCVVREKPLKGMGTNRGCRCPDLLERYIKEMRDELQSCVDRESSDPDHMEG